MPVYFTIAYIEHKHNRHIHPYMKHIRYTVYLSNTRVYSICAYILCKIFVNIICKTYLYIISFKILNIFHRFTKKNKKRNTI